MDRRRFVLTSVVGALAAPLGAEAQTAKVARVVIDPTELEPTMAALGRQGVDAVGVAMNRYLSNDRNRVAALAVAHRLPIQ